MKTYVLSTRIGGRVMNNFVNECDPVHSAIFMSRQPYCITGAVCLTTCIKRYTSDICIQNSK